MQKALVCGRKKFCKIIILTSKLLKKVHKMAKISLVTIGTPKTESYQLIFNLLIDLIYCKFNSRCSKF